MDWDWEELQIPDRNACGFPWMGWLVKLGSQCLLWGPWKHACGVVTSERGSCCIWGLQVKAGTTHILCGAHLVQPGVPLPCRQLHVLLQGLPQEEQPMLASWQARVLSCALRGLVLSVACASLPDSDGLVEPKKAPHRMGAGVGYQKYLLFSFSMIRVNVCGIYKVIWNISDF